MRQKKSQRYSNALNGFDDLPASANVRKPVVCSLLGCSDATVDRMSSDGRLPKPIKVTNRISAWNVGALRKAMAEL